MILRLGLASVLSEVFLTAVSKPDAQGLRHFFSLLFGEGFIELDCLLAFATAGSIIMSVPVAARHSDTAADFFEECFAREWCLIGFFLRGHREGAFLRLSLVLSCFAEAFCDELLQAESLDRDGENDDNIGDQ